MQTVLVAGINQAECYNQTENSLRPGAKTMDKRILANLYFFLERTAKQGLTLSEVEVLHEILSALKQLKPENGKGAHADDK
jgi:coenzyme F420-reducing hydrogenase delta subunit